MSRLAIAHGEPLPDEPNVSLALRIKQSVEALPDGRFLFVDADGSVSCQTYAEVFDQACRILNGLRLLKLRPGSPLLLYFSSCRKFIPALWASLLGGIPALPLCRDDWNRNHSGRIRGIVDHIRSGMTNLSVLTDVPAEQLGALGLSAGEIFRSDKIATGAPTAELHEADDDDGARLLVFTAGTTAFPKLAALSARAVRHRWWPNVPAHEHAAAFLSCSPFDHVMGLWIASPNFPTKAFLPPHVFVGRPGVWLDSVTRLGATHCTMTNFGMSLIARQAAEHPREHWDLRRIRKIGVGAESISPPVCRSFVEQLSPFGLRPDAVILGYGLSECGPVAGGTHHVMPTDLAGGSPFLLLDRPTPGHSVRIVSDQGELLEEEKDGQVEVRGPTMALGYFNDVEATKDLFTPDRWLRTGDLGFLREGRLVITGRYKETIHINAKKYACREIESLAESIEGIELAIAVDSQLGCADGKGRSGFDLFFVADAAKAAPLPVLIRQLREKSAIAFAKAPNLVIPIKAEAVPRTPSGKVQRFALANLLRSGELHETELSATEGRARETATEKAIARIWRELLGTDRFGLHDDFFLVGGDSLQATRLVLSLEEEFDRTLPARALHDETTIARLAAFFETGTLPESGSTRSRESQDPVISTERRIRALTAKWQGQRVAEGLIVGRNVEFGGAPLFWCLQTSREFKCLAERLDDRPFYGMRSGHLVMGSTKPEFEALAKFYSDEMLTIHPNGPFLIGGNCQGGHLAAEIAQRLLTSGREVKLLALVDVVLEDAFPNTSYPGKLAALYGRLSRFSPYRKFRQPELGFAKIAPAGVRLELLDCDHREYFSKRVAPELLAKLRAAIVWAQADEAATRASGTIASGTKRETAYRGLIKAHRSLTLKAGAARLLRVAVENRGSTAWHSETGVALANHWLSTQGELLVWSDARANLQDTLAPGRKARLWLEVRAPVEPGDYLLELDLVEEGIAWFKEKGSPTTIIKVRVITDGKNPARPSGRAPIEQKGIFQKVLNLLRFRRSFEKDLSLDLRSG